ncbi:hypothetical protein KKE06_05890 [Candidatus Micrarchaeota archaeon]|nr:hypothetical protein [Candidatus Micrarchaeota archaeon]MBU1930700.1 hypothetical protein [Candidatus Micrarchaeota archaeon]
MLTGMEVFEFFSDFNLILKIFVLLMIISFVYNHLGKGPMAWIIMIALVYFVLLDGWAFFGPVYILYMLLAMGFAGFLVDFFFMSQPLRQKQQPGGSGADMGIGPTSMDARQQSPGPHHGGRGPRAPPPG